MPRLRWRPLALAVCLLLTLYILLHCGERQEPVMVDTDLDDPVDPTWNPFEPYHHRGQKVKPFVLPAHEDERNVVEIWGKASVGLYLWQHVLRGPLEEKLGGVWSYGELSVGRIKFVFRTGPGVTPQHVPTDSQNLILVLNGMSPEKIVFSKKWLEAVAGMKALKNVGLVLLGDEGCHNEWLQPYLQRNGGFLSFVFLVYDSPEVDDSVFFQWPLGVATYRQFPLVSDSDPSMTQSARPYLCNFLATIYPGSSREHLLNKLKELPLAADCFVKPRMQWLPSETNMTRQMYIDALKTSDVTLHAVGENAECYRLYEALSFGSLPIVEDVRGIKPGQCSAPFRQLKELRAPLVYVEDWSDLEQLLAKEKKMSPEAKVKRRKELINWYQRFLGKLRRKFVSIVQGKFFLDKL